MSKRSLRNNWTGGNHSPWIICACRTLPALALCVALAHCAETEGSDLWPCHNRPPEGRWRRATMLMEPPVSRWQGMQKFSPRITAASVHTLCNLIPVGRQCQRLIMLWKAWGGGVLPWVRRFPFWFNFKFSACVCACVPIADGRWWCTQVCLSHALAANTPGVCRWRHTLFSMACGRVPGVEQGVGCWPHNDVLYG